MGDRVVKFCMMDKSQTYLGEYYTRVECRVMFEGKLYVVEYRLDIDADYTDEGGFENISEWKRVGDLVAELKGFPDRIADGWIHDTIVEWSLDHDFKFYDMTGIDSNSIDFILED